MFNAIIHTDTYEEAYVVNRSIPAILAATKLKAGQGILKAGIILAKDTVGEGVPYKKDFVESVGTGNTTLVAFAHTLVSAPVRPGSVVITDGTKILADTGSGNFIGDGTGYINYETGEVSVTFASAPAAVDITATYANKPFTALIEEVDTATVTIGRTIKTGAVVQDALLVVDAAPASVDIEFLESIGIYPLS